MTSAVDLCNRALDEISASSTVSSFSQASKEAALASRWYAPCRRMLLRAAPWGFARRQMALSLLGNSTAGTSLTPWAFKYLYPADCLKVRYLIPPALTDSSIVVTGTGIVTPSPTWRGTPFIVANEEHGAGSRTIVLTDLQNAIAVYIIDMDTEDQFDSSFTEALVATLAAKFAMPLTASRELTKLRIAIAQGMVDQARANDAGESISTTDHTPDWILARSGSAVPFDGPYGAGWSWEAMSWSM